mmetsp:Transcript_63484/g.160114  ORF Transcript_63484/g.160114 Transcript_63484/m.160114 type:complete len:90 (-) Transcript_63484:8-277(-)
MSKATTANGAGVGLEHRDSVITAEASQHEFATILIRCLCESPHYRIRSDSFFILVLAGLLQAKCLWPDGARSSATDMYSLIGQRYVFCM